uniref:Uncharacterized protein n=1 Tax=Anguilla anguilla TaxID=7936 RepID=A0A0E9UFA1_ANGAN
MPAGHQNFKNIFSSPSQNCQGHTLR